MIGRKRSWEACIVFLYQAFVLFWQEVAYLYHHFFEFPRKVVHLSLSVLRFEFSSSPGFNGQGHFVTYFIHLRTVTWWFSLLNWLIFSKSTLYWASCADCNCLFSSPSELIFPSRAWFWSAKAWTFLLRAISSGLKQSQLKWSSGFKPSHNFYQ